MISIRVHSAVVASLMLVHCATMRAAEPAPAGGETPAPPALSAEAAAPLPFEGMHWQLMAYRSGDALVDLKEGRGPTLFRLEGGSMAGNAGCNSLLGSYTPHGTGLTFDPRVASTMMACPEPIMAQEQAVSAALAGVASYRIESDVLELLDAQGQPLLRFVALKPSPLTAQTWVLTGYNNGKEAIVSVLDGTEITLEFRDDGTLGGSDGCNRYMSGYTLEDERLTIGPLATTRMACRGPEGAAEQAAAFARAMETVAGYRIEGGDLNLLTAEGSSAARFRAASLPSPAAPDVAEPGPAEPRRGP